MWAVRSQIEGCGVYTAPTPNDFTLDNLKYARSSGAHLEIPLNKLVEISDKSKIDIHLVLEYNGGDTILGYQAPRSNRLYFVHDPNGGKFA